MGRDNAGQRVLNARRALRGIPESLENTFGRPLPDGAQCFVIEEQANYRLIHSCALPEDGQYVVMPRGDKFGRWVRAEGLVGFALLEGGRLASTQIFGNWKYQKLVQFEVTPEALVYIGTVPRLAQLSAFAVGAQIRVGLLQGECRVVASGSESASGVAMLHPGERIALIGVALGSGETGDASLQVILA